MGKKVSRLITTLSAGIVLAVSAWALPAGALGGPSDFDNNAIVGGGVHSLSAVRQACMDNFVQAVWANFGINCADINSMSTTLVHGRVTRNNEVFVDTQSAPVATNAMTGGRQNMPGSTAVTTSAGTFFKRPPSVSFQQDSLPAYVSMMNGRFQFAIIGSCGNAVSATPVVRPANHVTTTTMTPTPSPTPTPSAPTPAPAQNQSQNQSQNQTQSVVVQTPATTATPTPTPTTTTPSTTTPTTNQEEVQQQPQVVAAAPAPTPVAAAPQSAPQTLPNTGPGSIVGLFAAATISGFLGYRRFLARRLSS